jgi:VWFA-related protein
VIRGLAAPACLLVFVLGQDAPVQRFRTEADAVRVDVLVLQGNRPVVGLTAADFELKDSGVIQQVDVATMDDEPVSVMLALDTSTSVYGRTLDRLKDSAMGVFDAVGPNGRVAVMTFGSSVELAADWSAPTAHTRAALSAVTAGGMTALYDAAFAALTARDPMPGRRSLIILFSDGFDTASWLPRSAAIETARRSDAVVYSVVRGDTRPEVTIQYRSGVELWPNQVRPTLDSPRFVRALSALTGGSTLVATNAQQLRTLFTRVIADFRSRYLLAYIPRGVDRTGWHPIEVKVKGRNLTVTARRGYAR